MRSTCDYVESEFEVTHQRVLFLSVSIGNIIDNFVRNITANDFYTVVGYSLPRCDWLLQVEYKHTIVQINTQDNVLVHQVFLVVILFQLHSPGIQSIR